jgi:pyruvate/2-oxoacid:ferredoxin oxidoreductase alpha subunit
MCSLTIKAFDIADEYRTPVYVVADGYIGQMMEPVEFPEPVTDISRKDWALYADEASKDNLISSIFLDPLELEAHNQKLQDKYAEIEKNEVICEKFMLDDAEYVLMGYGIVSRVLKTVVEKWRDKGLKIGMLRPVSLFPFPKGEIAKLAQRKCKFLVVEMSNGQMLDDVRLAVNGKTSVDFYNRMGGVVPNTEEIIEQVKKYFVD